MTTHQGSPPTQQRLIEFIEERIAPQHSLYRVSKLVGDASARQYFRLITEESRNFIIAVYPESFDLEKFTYYQVYSLFRSIGVPVPEAYAFDGARGIVLQQDLGDESLQKRLLSLPGGEWEPILRQTMDLIARIQVDGTERCDAQYEASKLAFDYEKLSFEFDFFFRYYVSGYRRLQYDTDQQSALYGEFDAISRQLASCRRYLAHRDFHCRNIMLLGDKIYLLDFQDARMGPATYDLVSILKDSIDVADSAMRSLVGYFLSLGHLKSEDHSDFWTQFELMSVQRLLKALGTYGYQITVRNNFIYQQYIPGTLRRAYQSVLRLERLPQIRELLERELLR